MMIATPRTMTEAIAMREKAEREDFAARVRGEHPDAKAFRAYIRGELRLAYRRAKLHAAAIHEAAKMVEAGVEPEQALSCLGDALDYLIPTPPAVDTSDIPEADDEWFKKAKLVKPEGKHDDAAEVSEPKGERELHVRGQRPEIHGYDIPNRGGAGSRVVSEQSQGGEPE